MPAAHFTQDTVAIQKFHFTTALEAGDHVRSPQSTRSVPASLSLPILLENRVSNLGHTLLTQPQQLHIHSAATAEQPDIGAQSHLRCYRGPLGGQQLLDTPEPGDLALAQVINSCCCHNGCVGHHMHTQM